jgi:integrase
VKVDVAVAEWAERFPRPAASTTANNSSQAKHFGEHFAGRELGSIDRDEFERFAQVYPGAARYARTLLNDYTDAGMLDVSPSEGVRIPRLPKRKVIVPTVEEVVKLVSTARNVSSTRQKGNIYTHMATMIPVAAYTGLREGEQRALAVVDLRERGEHNDVIEAEVEYSIDRREQLKAPKTKSSQDTFTFLGATPRIMRTLSSEGWSQVNRDAQTPVREGRFWPMTRAQRQTAWDYIRRQAGVSVTWHSLRHFCATWLLDNDASIDDVALQLRCSVEEIRATYGHPNRKAALARLRAISDA